MKTRYRLCIGCRNLYIAEELIKIKINKGKIFINPEFYLSGRSAYLCYNMECILRAKRDKKLEKNFKINIRIPELTWQILKNLITTREKNVTLSSEMVEGK